MKKEQASPSTNSIDSDTVKHEHTEGKHWLKEEDKKQPEEFQAYISSQQNG